MNTNPRPVLIPVTYADGIQRYATAGATQQGGRAALKECSACGGYVVFVKSIKTGKWYLADCSRYNSDGLGEAYYYRKDKPHFASCEKRQADNARTTRSIIEDEITRAKSAAMDLIFHDPANVNLGRSELRAMVDAAWAEIDARYADRLA